MSKISKQTVGTIQILSAAVCWGSLGLFGSWLNRAGFNGVQVASLRIVCAALLLLLALPYFLPVLRDVRVRVLPMMMLQSLLGVLGMSVLYFAAVAKVGVSLAVALLYTSPIWSVLFARLILGEAMTRKSVLLTLVAAFGVGLTMAGGVNLDVWGMVMGLGSGVCYALYGVLGKRVMNQGSPMLLLFSSVWIAALALLCLPYTHEAMDMLWHKDVSVWLALLGVAFIGTILAFTLFIRGLAKMPASQAAVFTVFEPFTAVILASVLLGEYLSDVQYIGIVLIIVVAVANAVKTKKMPSASANGSGN